MISRRPVFTAALCVATALCLPTPSTGQISTARIAKLIRDLQGTDVTRRERAMEELTAAGRAAVPQLVSHISPEGDVLSSELRAVRILGRMGKAATASIPDLLALLPEKPSLRNALVLALGRIGPYAQQYGPRIRGTMIQLMVGNLGNLADPNRFRAITSLAGDDTEAARTFSRTLLDPEDSTEELVRALQDQNPYVRAFAAELLFTRGEVNESIIAGLHKAVREPHPAEVLCEEPGWGTASTEVDLDRYIHRLAATALVHLAPEDPRCIDGHRILLDQIDPELRRNAVMALGHLGSAAAPALPQILELLQSDELAIRREAVTTLGMIGPEARAAIPLLEQLTENRDRQLAERARVALGRIR